MSIKINAIGLFVNNMNTMVKFYRDIVGLATEWNGEANADFNIGETRLIMYGRKDFEKMTNSTFSYPSDLNGTMELAFNFPTYEAVDEEFVRLVELGAKPVMEPKTMPWGQRTSYVADPEGNLIEIGSFGVLELNDDKVTYNEQEELNIEDSIEE